MDRIYIVKKGTRTLTSVPKKAWENRKDLYKDYRLPTKEEAKAAGIEIEKPVKPEPKAPEKPKEVTKPESDKN